MCVLTPIYKLATMMPDMPGSPAPVASQAQPQPAQPVQSQGTQPATEAAPASTSAAQGPPGRSDPIRAAADVAPTSILIAKWAIQNSIDGALECIDRITLGCRPDQGLEGCAIGHIDGLREHALQRLYDADIIEQRDLTAGRELDHDVDVAVLPFSSASDRAEKRSALHTLGA